MAFTPEQAEQVRAKLLEQISQLPQEQAAGLREQAMAATAEQLEAYAGQSAAPLDGAGAQGGGCLFCGIAQGKIDTVRVYEDANVVAFLDITPTAPGQIILVPKEHNQYIFQLPDQIVWEMMKLVKVMMPIMVNATSAHGVSIYIAQGHAAGQNMDHLSINLVPRFDGDKATFAWERKPAEKKDLDAVAQKIIFGLDKTFREERDKIEKIMREKAEAERPKSMDELGKFPQRNP